MDSRHNALEDLYLQKIPRLLGYLREACGGLGSLQEVYGPFLMDCWDEDYARSDCRFMVIGQQTNAWYSLEEALQSSDPVRELMQKYRCFDLGREYCSPFLLAAHYLNCALNGPQHWRGFVWTDLWKLADPHGKLPRQVWNRLLDDFSLLPQEVAACEPEAVVFFTGPSCDGALERTFPGLEKESVPGAENGLREIARLRHERLPDRTFRTYHPQYLCRRGNGSDLFRLLIEALLKSDA